MSNIDKSIAQMFTRISPWYDFLNHFLSFGIDIYWRKKLIQAIPKKKNLCTFLDLATGTMDVVREIEKKYPEARIIGLDLSYKMLYIGKKKSFNTKVLPLCANGKKLPIASNSIDVATISFGIRNINPRNKVYEEVLRVLKPGGIFLILEFASAKKQILFGLYNLYLSYLLPLIGNFISKDKGAYKYLRDTIKKFPLAHELKQELLKAGFKKVNYKSLTGGIAFIYKVYK